MNGFFRTFATSEPACPIAMPTSARLSEGDSLTPSPVYLMREQINPILYSGILTIAQNLPRR